MCEEMSFWSICGDFSNVIATGLAALSIWLTIKEQKKIHRREDNLQISQQKILWYNKVVLEDIIVQVNLFIDNTEKKIEKSKVEKVTVQEWRKLYNEINRENQVLREKIMILNIFSKQLYIKTDLNLQSIFDEYSRYIDDISKNKGLIFLNKSEIYKLRVIIIEKLYNYGNDFLAENIT